MHETPRPTLDRTAAREGDLVDHDGHGDVGPRERGPRREEHARARAVEETRRAPAERARGPGRRLGDEDAVEDGHVGRERRGREEHDGNGPRHLGEALEERTQRARDAATRAERERRRVDRDHEASAFS